MHELQAFSRMGTLDWAWVIMWALWHMNVDLIVGPAYSGLPKRGRVRWNWEFTDDIPMRRQHTTYDVGYESSTPRAWSN